MAEFCEAPPLVSAQDREDELERKHDLKSTSEVVDQSGTLRE
jgi:hypothetical protein